MYNTVVTLIHVLTCVYVIYSLETFKYMNHNTSLYVNTNNDNNRTCIKLKYGTVCMNTNRVGEQLSAER